MNPVEAVATCLRKYVTFTGYASRPEYWWFALFQVLAVFGALLADAAAGTDPLFYAVVVFGLFLPALAVTVRRLHDTGRSGWWILIGLVPFIGGIWLLILLVAPSQGVRNGWA